MIGETKDHGPCIMNTAGPSKLVSLYEELDREEQSKIYLIPVNMFPHLIDTNLKDFLMEREVMILSIA